MTAEEAFNAAALAACGKGEWPSRAVFWSAVRFGMKAVEAARWADAEERWSALWRIAEVEHLPPIPQAPLMGAPASVVQAKTHLARMHEIVGSRRPDVLR
ncbi:hypothetical protein [Ralstonia flatus]|uniref:Uncharacterized protein n=1 Tax=Ralstonia flatus TaxID=3058601 RepID=A0AAD2BVW7_9RALS|nr:hypothetical protein [Ralstonia sp. LMG 32965]MBN6211216.1 hypothetical protein [Ralstonia pickettii]CAJ0859790.1 hypothetical protein R77567_01397 [Ralstonia sp. LMG 32965]CAJ0867838.1 hypothetical protein R77564_01414 [Ralstonia sp. LMG 32965]